MVYGTSAGGGRFVSFVHVRDREGQSVLYASNEV